MLALKVRWLREANTRESLDEEHHLEELILLLAGRKTFAKKWEYNLKKKATLPGYAREDMVYQRWSQANFPWPEKRWSRESIDLKRSRSGKWQLSLSKQPLPDQGLTILTQPQLSLEELLGSQLICTIFLFPQTTPVADSYLEPALSNTTWMSLLL